MRKSLTALAAAIIAVAAVTMPTTADARWRGWWGPALGGFAVGALVGSALARPYYGYGYPAYYGYGYPAYGYSYPAYYGYSYPPYYGYGDRNYFGYYGARY